MPVSLAPKIAKTEAILVGKSAMVRTAPRSDLEMAGFGKRLDDQRLMIVPGRTPLPHGRGRNLGKKNGTALTAEEYFAFASDSDQELAEERQGLHRAAHHHFIPRTGYKFGHHFRVLREERALRSPRARDRKGSGHAHERHLPFGQMAHSVKKKMFFGCVHTNGIQFVEFARIKL